MTNTDETRPQIALTLEEKVALTGGADLWRTPAVERAGVRSLVVTDGPSGARGERFTGGTSTSFPCGAAIAATWDRGLVRRVGAALAAEARAKGADLLLGPTVNLVRVPLAGRSFECYGEDPFLTAETAVSYIQGCQEAGVGCCVKHLVCNDQEHERMLISAEVDERTLRELYLRPFEAAVRQAGVWAVMAAYNRLDGTHCSEHRWLLTDLLKHEWGFDGLVVSDWFGTHSTAAAARAGLDLEMPGPPRHLGPRLLEVVRDGTVAEAEVDDKVARLVRLLARTNEREPGGVDAVALAREAAAAAIVLMQNDGVLPLRGDERVAVIGPLADPGEAQGGGSAQVTPPAVVGPLDGIRARGGTVVHEPGCETTGALTALDPRNLRTPDGAQGLLVEYLDGDRVLYQEVTTRTRLVWMGELYPGSGVGATCRVRASARFTPHASGPWELAVSSVGPARLLLDGEVLVDNGTPEPGSSFFGAGSTERTSTCVLAAGTTYGLVLELEPPALPIAGVSVSARPPLPADSMARAEAAAAEADVAVVVVGATSDWETEGKDRPHLRLPGRQDELVERVAAANPRTVVVVNGGSAYEMPWADGVGAVVQLWFPGQEGGHALADVLFGERDASGRLPITVPYRHEDLPAAAWYPGEGGSVRYGEGLEIGYRARDLRARYPFGHGLSYTTFTYERVDALDGPDGLRVVVDLCNTGSRRGSEVVQVYVRAPRAPVWRPDRELKGFEKLTLDPGERRTVEVVLDDTAFARWDADSHGWTVDPGPYEVLVGSSSQTIHAALPVVR